AKERRAARGGVEVADRGKMKYDDGSVLEGCDTICLNEFGKIRGETTAVVLEDCLGAEAEVLPNELWDSHSKLAKGKVLNGVLAVSPIDRTRVQRCLCRKDKYRKKDYAVVTRYKVKARKFKVRVGNEILSLPARSWSTT